MPSHKARKNKGQQISSPSTDNDGIAVPSSSQTQTTRGTSQSLLNSSAPKFEPGVPSSQTMAPINFLNRGSTADADAHDGMPVIVSSTPSQSMVDKTNLPAPIGPPTGGAATSGSRGTVTFTTDTGPQAPWVGGHYLRIANVTPESVDAGMHTLKEECDWKSVVTRDVVTKDATSQTHLVVFVRFNDIRKAAEAEDQVAMVNQDWQVTYVSHTDYATGIEPYLTAQQKFADPSSHYDGQVLLLAKFVGNMSDFNAEVMLSAVQYVALDFGEVLAFQPKEITATQWQIRVEYFMITAGQACIQNLMPSAPYCPPGWEIVAQQMPEAGYNSEPAMSDSFSDELAELTTTPRKQKMGPGYHHSPTGRTSWSVDDQGNMVLQPPALRIPKVFPGHGGVIDSPSRHMSVPTHGSPAMYDQAVVVNRHASYPDNTPRHLPAYKKDDPNGPQVVRLERIIDGTDVRTTVMIRNIPNGWGYRRFKRALDEVTPNRYDFSYLRMDFAKNTNVGYAFVNFADAKDIMRFVQRFVGEEWDHDMAPGKVCAISYATIQGIDCLVEKFRNSAILDEFPEYVPKLWWMPHDVGYGCTQDMVGTEKAFPPANNLTKRQRSHDNAGSIGLYTPRSGQRGDRSRHSNWDRGTPHQMREEAMYGPQMSPFDGNYALVPHAPIGTPAQHFQPMMYRGYPQVMPPMPNGHTTAAGFVQYGFAGGAPYQHPPQFHSQGGYPGYGAFAGPHPSFSQFGTMNPASRLRTTTQGRLGGHPRNVTVAPNGYCDPAAASSSRTPRTLMASDEQAPADDNAGNGYHHQQGYGPQHGYGNLHGYAQQQGNGQHHGGGYNNYQQQQGGGPHYDN